MDIVMPLTDGITAMQTIIAAHPGVHIIALTSFEDAVMVKAAIAAGASGYLLKNVSAHDLAAAIRTTMNGLPAMSPEATQVLMNASKQAPPQAAAAYGLTERELDVLRLVVRGLSNNEIAARLEVSPFTIKNHVSSILSKLNVMSRTEAATLALQQRLVQLDS
jgi:DNA-binding NarL/FixJ family response regulator